MTLMHGPSTTGLKNAHYQSQRCFTEPTFTMLAYGKDIFGLQCIT